MTSNAKRSVVCLFLLLGILSMSAIAANQNRIGTAGAQELLIPVGARGVALGPSAMVFARGADAIYFNPAGLGRMDRSVEAMFSQMSYFADINVSYGAIGVSAGSFGSLGFTLKTISFGDIPVTTSSYPGWNGRIVLPDIHDHRRNVCQGSHRQDRDRRDGELHYRADPEHECQWYCLQRRHPVSEPGHPGTGAWCGDQEHRART